MPILDCGVQAAERAQARVQARVQEQTRPRTGASIPRQQPKTSNALEARRAWAQASAQAQARAEAEAEAEGHVHGQARQAHLTVAHSRARVQAPSAALQFAPLWSKRGAPGDRRPKQKQLRLESAALAALPCGTHERPRVRVLVERGPIRP